MSTPAKNELPHPYRCMVLLAGCTGLRISEVMGLRWTSINFADLVMEVREGFARSQVTKLKSELSQDELPLDPDVATILLEWKRLCPATEGDWVFPSPRTNKPYDSGSLRKKVLKIAASRAKIQGQIGWHTLRHSYRAWLDETGVPRRTAETYASRQYLNNDECLRWSLHGSEAQSQHIRPLCNVCWSKTAPNSKRPSYGRPRSRNSKLIGPIQTTIENPNSS
jgi:integrase